MNKRGEWRNREETQKLKYFIEELSFFQSLKKENEADDDIIYQCCKELKYRRYAPGETICKYGEEGNEFYVIIKGKVTVYTPKTIEVTKTLTELPDYILANKDWILWDRSNRHLLE